MLISLGIDVSLRLDLQSLPGLLDFLDQCLRGPLDQGLLALIGPLQFVHVGHSASVDTR